MPQGNGKIIRGSKFDSIEEVKVRLPGNHAVVLYRPEPKGKFVAYDDSGDLFHPHERKCIEDNFASALIIDPTAFKVFRGKV